MNVIKLWNTRKYIFATLISLMLVTSFAASNIFTVKAATFPWEGTITLHATESLNPYWGYYGGYHDIWYAIKTELAKIGINLELNLYDDFTWYERCWEENQWNASWDEGGWDMTIYEWWLQPHGLEPWFTSMVLGTLTPIEGGFNSHPWVNPKADELLMKGMTSFDAETRQYYMWKWQEVFMDDPPWINIYYPVTYEVMGAWMDGYDSTGCWWYDVQNLTLNPSKMPAQRKALRQDWVYYAVSEEVWNLLPMFMDTYTEEQMCTLQWRTLYKWSLNWTNYVAGTEPDPTDYIIVPDLALTDPYPVDGNYTHMRVDLRPNVKWSDFDTSGEYVDAQDITFSINVTCLDRRAGNTGTGDFIWIIDHAEEVDSDTVDFILKQECPDLKSVLADDWGGSIVPYHILGKYEDAPSGIKNDPSNGAYDNPEERLPVNGPFYLKEIVAGEYVLLERNPHYFGYDIGWGPHSNVTAIYLKTVRDPAVRLLEFQTYQLDCGEYPTAPLEVWKQMETDPNLIVFQYLYPASNPIWLNFDNEYLSNRWIRLAIAHAIPYERIFSEILTSWGIETAYPGKTYVLPNQYYTEPNTGGDLTGSTVQLFNTELEAWHYDLAKAEDYMWLWYNSAYEPDTVTGAVGDADYGGLVDLDDFLIWRANAEAEPGITWPQEERPGYVLDPDFNNDNDVDLEDYDVWLPEFGAEY